MMTPREPYEELEDALVARDYLTPQGRFPEVAGLVATAGTVQQTFTRLEPRPAFRDLASARFAERVAQQTARRSPRAAPWRLSARLSRAWLGQPAARRALWAAVRSPAALFRRLSAWPPAAGRSPWPALWRPAGLGVATLLLLLFGIVGVAAAEHALPGEPLYPLKRAHESVQLALADDVLTRAELHADFADRRADELRRLGPATPQTEAMLAAQMVDHWQQASEASRILAVDARDDAVRQRLERLRARLAQSPVHESLLDPSPTVEDPASNPADSPPSGLPDAEADNISSDAAPATASPDEEAWAAGSPMGPGPEPEHAAAFDPPPGPGPTEAPPELPTPSPSPAALGPALTPAPTLAPTSTPTGLDITLEDISPPPSNGALPTNGAAGAPGPGAPDASPPRGPAVRPSATSPLDTPRPSPSPTSVREPVDEPEITPRPTVRLDPRPSLTIEIPTPTPPPTARPTLTGRPSPEPTQTHRPTPEPTATSPRPRTPTPTVPTRPSPTFTALPQRHDALPSPGLFVR